MTENNANSPPSAPSSAVPHHPKPAFSPPLPGSNSQAASLSVLNNQNASQPGRESQATSLPAPNSQNASQPGRESQATSLPAPNSQTRLLGVIGDPIVHSLSPLIHNFLCQQTGQNSRYLAFEVKKERLEQALEGVRALGVLGLNVTSPHKEAVVPYLDEVTEEARLLGAVNTILHKEGKLLGANTDPAGFLLSLERKKIDPAGWKVVLLGAGGAAAAVACALSQRSVARITLCNRSAKRAWALARRLACLGTPIEVCPLEHCAAVIEEAALVVQATPVGALPDDAPLLAPSWLHKDLFLYDLLYHPPQTRLLQEAQARGVQTSNGLEMLLFQGLESFRLWTGHPWQRDWILPLLSLLQQEVQKRGPLSL